MEITMLFSLKSNTVCPLTVFLSLCRAGADCTGLILRTGGKGPICN